MNGIKAILFDVDGIVIKRKELFSVRLARELRIAAEQVEEFFKNDFRECSFGRADLKEKIAPYLPQWGWKGNADELMEYWFDIESETDKEVLLVIDDLRAKGIGCHIATRQEKYRLAYLLDTVGLKDHFDVVFATCDIGYDKWQPDFFEHALRKLGLRPTEIMFFDDNPKNIHTARRMEIAAYLYENIDMLKEHTAPLLS